MILLDDVKLNLLLEQKKQFIGKRVVLDSVLSAVSLLISVFLASYHDVFGVPAVVLKTVFIILGLFFTAKSVCDVINSSKNNYSYKDLLTDISKLNQITHDHSIIVIKDTFNQFSNRYLVYDDRRWEGCKLFLNYKDNINNETFIKDHISNELKIPESDIGIEYKGYRIHEKFSQSAKKNKVYNHKFYLVTIKEFPKHMKKDAFECEGKAYYWKRLVELEADPKVRESNMDIVNYVNEMF